MYHATLLIISSPPAGLTAYGGLMTSGTTQSLSRFQSGPAVESQPHSREPPPFQIYRILGIMKRPRLRGPLSYRLQLNPAHFARHCTYRFTVALWPVFSFLTAPILVRIARGCHVFHAGGRLVNLRWWPILLQSPQVVLFMGFLMSAHFWPSMDYGGKKGKAYAQPKSPSSKVQTGKML